MALVKLLHNHKAGDKELSHDDLISLIESKGFSCEYSSVKTPEWHKISNDVDFLIIAGGDGTVRRVVEKLLDRKLIEKKFPMAILPLGTANNLAKTLGLDIDTDRAVESWLNFKKRPFDVGKIYGLKKNNFFLEGFGFGIFPYLIKKMLSPDIKESTSTDEKINIALKELFKIVQDYQTTYCKVLIDGADHSGNYLMVEIMNIHSIGPNLNLGPEVWVDDGKFDVVLVAENDRDELAKYVSNKLNGIEIRPHLKVIKGQDIVLNWQGTDCHIDDQPITIKENSELKVEIQKNLLEFL